MSPPVTSFPSVLGETWPLHLLTSFQTPWAPPLPTLLLSLLLGRPHCCQVQRGPCPHHHMSDPPQPSRPGDPLPTDLLSHRHFPESLSVHLSLLFIPLGTFPRLSPGPQALRPHLVPSLTLADQAGPFTVREKSHPQCPWSSPCSSYPDTAPPTFRVISQASGDPLPSIPGCHKLSHLDFLPLPSAVLSFDVLLFTPVSPWRPIASNCPCLAPNCNPLCLLFHSQNPGP